MVVVNQLVLETNMNIDQLSSLQEGLVEFLRAFAPCFSRQPGMDNLNAYSIGLLADVKRKSIEPIALAAGRDERTLQWFLAQGLWDHDRARGLMHHRVAARRDSVRIGVLDASGHAKKGDKTPGVQRQWCGELGKNENCVVGQHLLYTDNDPGNPFSCMLASDLFLPESWDRDRDRCRGAKIPDTVVHRTKWKIGTDQLALARSHGIHFDWVIGDEDYGNVPAFWFDLDRQGLRGVAEVRSCFCAWTTPPSCLSSRPEHAAKSVKHLVAHSPVFTSQPWVRYRLKTTTLGPVDWEVKAAPVQLVAQADPSRNGKSVPTDRRYWLIVASNVKTKEIKYLVSNALDATVEEMLQTLLARWHVEKWFERAKQEVGLGAFEMRNYQGLMRHWLICGMVMLFLSEQTNRLRGEKSGDYVGAGRQRRQPHRLECLGPATAEPPAPVPHQPLLSASQPSLLREPPETQ
jgi:SRSO17 transposase